MSKSWNGWYSHRKYSTLTQNCIPNSTRKYYLKKKKKKKHFQTLVWTGPITRSKQFQDFGMLCRALSRPIQPNTHCTSICADSFDQSVSYAFLLLVRSMHLAFLCSRESNCVQNLLFLSWLKTELDFNIIIIITSTRIKCLWRYFPNV